MLCLHLLVTGLFEFELSSWTRRWADFATERERHLRTRELAE